MVLFIWTLFPILINSENSFTNEILYCKCGMDHSDPYAKLANTDCRTIQYHNQTNGIDGNWTGISIVNSTTCSIDLKDNPNGICRKTVTAHNENNNLQTTSERFAHIEITWSCVTHDIARSYPQNSCAKRVELDTFCCNKDGHSCEDGRLCDKGKTDYGNYCNDHHRTTIEEAFWKDRTLKRAKRTLYILIIIILIGVVVSWLTYRRNPTQTRQIMIALFGKCCNLFGNRMHPNSQAGSFRPSFPRDNNENLINEPTNGLDPQYSQCTKDTYLPDIDGSGSGAGPTVCVQRTIARQIRCLERVGKGRYGTVYKGEWQGESVAMKKFHTTEEKSWNHEVGLYKTQSLAHENILTFRAADNKDNSVQIELWLITEYHENGSLYDYLSTHKLTKERCMRMALSIAAGLDHLHKNIQGTLTSKNPIAHRDIKSKNILVKDNLECCIADLGLACECGPNGTVLGDPLSYLEPRQTVGTVRYLAPEYLKTELFNDYLDLTKADIYSTALVFWELLNRTIGFQPEVPEYNQPYFDMVPSEPTIEDMRTVVVAVPIRRPAIPVEYMNQIPCLDLEKANPLLFLTGVVRECWQERPLARLTALRLKKDLKQLVTKQFPYH